MKKLLLIVAMMSMTLTFAQTLSSEDEKTIDKIYNGSEKGISTVYNDGKNVVTTVYSDAKKLSPKIESAIKSLATELKTTTDMLWDILVKQQLVWSIGFLILTITSMFNWYLFYKRNYSSKKDIEWTVLERDLIGDIPNENFDNYYYKRSLENPEMYENDIRKDKYVKGPIGKEQYNAPKDYSLTHSDNKKSFHWLHFCICLCLSGLSIYHFMDMLTGFFNPEFSALMTILDVAKSLK